MEASREVRVPLKTFRGIAVAVIVVSLSIAAAIGIYVVVSGSFGELESKVMLTTATTGAFGIVALCDLAAADKPIRAIAWVGFPIALATFVVALVLIWRPDFVLQRQAPAAYQDLWEPWWRALGVGTVLSLATAHASLLLRLVTRRQRAVRTVVTITVGLAGIVAVLQIVPIVTDDFDPGDAYWRLLAAAYILLALGTIVSPVVGVLLKHAVSHEDLAAAATETVVVESPAAPVPTPSPSPAADRASLTLSPALSSRVAAAAAVAGQSPEAYLDSLLPLVTTPPHERPAPPTTPDPGA